MIEGDSDGLVQESGLSQSLESLQTLSDTTE